MASVPIPIQGVLLNEYRYDGLTNHVDLPSVKHLANINSKDITNFGTLDIWAYTRKAEVPFMVANIQQKSIEYVNGNHYKFNLPTAGDCSTYIESVDAEDMSRIGYGRQPFKVTVKGKHLGGYGAQVMFDYMSPYIMEVVDFERKGTDAIVYDMVYKGSFTNEDTLPSYLLQKGSRLKKIVGVRSAEFGQDYDSWAAGPSNTTREYLGMLSNGQLQTHYHMTDEACRFFDESSDLIDSKKLTEGLNSVVEYIGIKGDHLNGIRTFNEYMANGGSADKIGFRYMAMKYDDICMGILAKQNMNAVVWHPGSPVGSDGFDQQYFAPGIWHQLDYSGYKFTFNIENFSADIILAGIQDFESGKVTQTNYGNERSYRIRTGRGGRQLLNQAFEKYGSRATGLVDAKEFKQITGDNVTGLNINLPYYNSIRIPGIAILTIEEDPSLDQMNDGNDFINPKLSTGHRLSSYSMIIEDYNTDASNIKILRNKNLGTNRIRMEVIAGDRTHPMYEETYKGATVHQGSNLSTGFASYFRMTPDTAFVVDPTKILKFVPINPKTGLASF